MDCLKTLLGKQSLSAESQERDFQTDEYSIDSTATVYSNNENDLPSTVIDLDVTPESNDDDKKHENRIVALGGGQDAYPARGNDSHIESYPLPPTVVDLDAPLPSFSDDDKFLLSDIYSFTRQES